MAAQALGHTLDATALLHEAYLRLVADLIRRSAPLCPALHPQCGSRFQS
jgi:hypothetical protein